jgi:hypothetical protein
MITQRTLYASTLHGTMQCSAILRPIASAMQSRSFSVARPFASAAYARLAAPRSAIAVNGAAPIASLAAAAPKFAVTSFQVTTFPPPGRMRGDAPAAYRSPCYHIGFSFRVCGKCSRMSPFLRAPNICHGHTPPHPVQGADVMKPIVSTPSLSCHWTSLPQTEAAGSGSHPKLGEFTHMQAFAGFSFVSVRIPWSTSQGSKQPRDRARRRVFEEEIK